MRIRVFLHPASSQQKIIAQKDIEGNEYFVVWVKSKPVEGAANAELQEVLAEHFSVAKTRVIITHGGTSRYKVVDIKR